MYEKSIVFTEHDTMHRILTIDDQSGRLMRWRLRLAEFDFELKYKKGRANTQDDALSRLDWMSETIINDNNTDIRLLDLKFVNLKLELKKVNYDTDLIDVQHVEINEVYWEMDDPEPPYSAFNPIGVDSFQHEQMHTTNSAT